MPVASDVFFRGFDRDDLIAVASLAVAHYDNNAFQSQQIFRSIDAGEFQLYPGTVLTPDVYTYLSEDALRVSIKGTDNELQWIAHFMSSGVAPFPYFDGMVNAYFGSVAASIGQTLWPVIEATGHAKEIAFVGHSFGAALAQLLTNYLANRGGYTSRAIALGCPRIGTEAFANANAARVWRVERDVDVVCAIPPSIWFIAGTGGGLPIGGVPVVIKHAGKAQTLDAGGTLTDGSNPMNPAEVTYYLAKGQIEPHKAESYLAALKQGMKAEPPASTDQEFQIPKLLQTAVDAQLGINPRFVPVGREEEMALPTVVQGLMFFSSKVVPQGWSESIYTMTSVTAMTNLLVTLIPERAKGLSADCQIIGYRASMVNPPFDSFTNQLTPPTDGVITGGCNEPGDCFLYNLSAHPHRRRVTFRGISDADIVSGLAKAAPNPSKDALELYLGLLQTNTQVIKIIDPANSVFPVTSMQNLPNGGEIQVTVGGFHGLESGAIINLRGLRGYPYLMGRWKVGKVNDETISLKGSDRYQISSTNEGEIQQVTYSGIQSGGWNFRGVGYHETGSPFFRVRGRNSAKVLHH